MDPEEKQNEENYRTLVRLIEGTHLDNMKVLRALISTGEDQPIVHGATKTRVIHFHVSTICSTLKY